MPKLPRILRMTSLVVLGILLVATGASWLRSDRHADRLHGRLWGRGSFLIGCKQGRIVIAGFRSPGHPRWWQWGIHSYAVDDELSFPVGPVQQYDGKLGVGWIENPLYFVMRPDQVRPDGRTIVMWGAATATLRGHAVLIAHWLMALVTASALMLLVMGRRFSLRGFFIWVTMVMVVVGTAVIMDDDVPVSDPLPDQNVPLPSDESENDWKLLRERLGAGLRSQRPGELR